MKSGLAASRRREAVTGPSAEGEESFGARWNGLTNVALVVAPREASRKGSDRRRFAGARNTRRFGRFTSLVPRGLGYELVSPKRGSLAQARRAGAPQGVLVRGPAPPPIRGARSGASRLARKHVSFRRLQKLDSERHGAAAGVSNHDGSRSTSNRSTSVGRLIEWWRKQG